MSWTDGVRCSHCQRAAWSVRGGVWTCSCGKPMTVAEIESSRELKPFQEELS